MLWFKGSTTEAIEISRRRKCLFVLVITSYDKASRRLLDILDDPDASQLLIGCICVSLKSYSNEARHFCQLYNATTTPVIILIGLRGSPLEVIKGAVNKAETVSKIKKALASLERENRPQYVQQKQAHLISSTTPSPKASSSFQVPAVTPGRDFKRDIVEPLCNASMMSKAKSSDNAKEQPTNEPKFTTQERQQLVSKGTIQESQQQEPMVQAHFKKSLLSQKEFSIPAQSKLSEMPLQESVLRNHSKISSPSQQELSISANLVLPTNTQQLKVPLRELTIQAHCQQSEPYIQDLVMETFSQESIPLEDPTKMLANNQQSLSPQEQLTVPVEKQLSVLSNEQIMMPESIQQSLLPQEREVFTILPNEKKSQPLLPQLMTPAHYQLIQLPLRNSVIQSIHQCSSQQQQIVQVDHQHSQSPQPTQRQCQEVNEPIQYQQIFHRQLRTSPPMPDVTVNIVIRRPDGAIVKKLFPSNTKLSEVRSFVDAKFKPDFSPYILVKTSEPLMELNDLHMSKSLREIGLVSVGSLLVMPSKLSDWKPYSGLRAGGREAVKWSVLPWLRRVWHCVRGYVVRPRRFHQMTQSTSAGGGGRAFRSRD